MKKVVLMLYLAKSFRSRLTPTVPANNPGSNDEHCRLDFQFGYLSYYNYLWKYRLRSLRHRMSPASRLRHQCQQIYSTMPLRVVSSSLRGGQWRLTFLNHFRTVDDIPPTPTRSL